MQSIIATVLLVAAFAMICCAQQPPGGDGGPSKGNRPRPCDGATDRAACMQVFMNCAKANNDCKSKVAGIQQQQPKQRPHDGQMGPPPQQEQQGPPPQQGQQGPQPQQGQQGPPPQQGQQGPPPGGPPPVWYTCEGSPTQQDCEAGVKACDQTSQPCFQSANSNGRH